MPQRVRPIRLLLLLLLGPLGCSQDHPTIVLPANAPIVRVRLLQDQPRVMLSAAAAPIVAAGAARVRVDLSTAAPLELAGDGWRMGSLSFAGGELSVLPAVDGTIRVNGLAYRGSLRFVPTSAGRFDVVNDLPIDAYLMGVLPMELPAGWEEAAYRAQAIVARTYALYESRTAGSGRAWDLLPDQRSQVYGGLAAETAKSRRAVQDTVGIVVACGSPGHERIFKAYFSSCCGGVRQSAADAFGDPPSEQLGAQSVGTLCSESTHFNWGPIVLSKDELTRRIRIWGQRHNEPEKSIARVSRIDIQAVNVFGRPVRFLLTDSRGVAYSLRGEDMRSAVNTDAPPAAPGSGTTLLSSFFKPVNDVDSIRFVDGHGFGHGVGMCQWCAQRQAEQGMRAEDIVLSAYPHSRLVRAY